MAVKGERAVRQWGFLRLDLPSYPSKKPVEYLELAPQRIFLAPQAPSALCGLSEIGFLFLLTHNHHSSSAVSLLTFSYQQHLLNRHIAPTQTRAVKGEQDKMLNPSHHTTEETRAKSRESYHECDDEGSPGAGYTATNVAFLIVGLFVGGIITVVISIAFCLKAITPG
jgi:hypothetical protein